MSIGGGVRAVAGVPSGFGERMLRRLPFLYHPIARFIAAEGRLQPRVVDLGTGSGIALEHVRRHVPSARLVGLDLRHEPVRLGAAGIAFVQGDAQELPFATGSIDHVVIRSALCYCGDPAQVLREVLRVLVPGGSACITDSNPGRWRRWLIIVIGMTVLRRSYEDMAGFAERAISRQQLTAALADAGATHYRYRRIFLGTYFHLILRKL
ncbi:MAG TPA: class I SAM-dependent methyltransferase [Terriglobales bacterium]|nr:class I SAM-dependent methyltransferase [Terriglobales bacterium]